MPPAIDTSTTLLHQVTEADSEPWMELFGKLEDHYRKWKFASKHFMVPDDTRVRDLYEVMYRFHTQHPETWCDLQVFDPTFIQIVRYRR